MGYPWPRHRCFPRARTGDETPIERFLGDLPKSEDVEIFKVQGVICDDPSKGRLIVLANALGTTSVWRALPATEWAFLIGGIVAFRKKKKFIVDCAGKEIPVFGPFHSCGYCGRHFLPETMAQHVRTAHPMRRCHRCGQRVEVRHWDDHQEGHLGPRIRSL